MGFFDDVGKLTSIAAKVAKEKVGEVSQDIKKANAEQEILNRKKDEERQQAILEQTAQEEKIKALAKNVIVTTGDIRQDYEIIRPVFFYLSHSKAMSLFKKYSEECKEIEEQLISFGYIKKEVANYDLAIIGDFILEKYFFIAVEEWKRVALSVGGNAIICMRYDFDLTDINDYKEGVLRMYGTAVKIKESLKIFEGVFGRGKFCGVEIDLWKK